LCPVKVPLALGFELLHVPLRTWGFTEVLRFPVQAAVPAVPLYVVPETRLPDTPELPELSVAVPETLPPEVIVALQVPESPPLKLPE